MIDIKDDGSFMLDQNYFNYATGLTMTNKKFNNLFGQNPRDPNKDQLTQFHMDIASSIQAVTEEIILKLKILLFGLKTVLCLAEMTIIINLKNCYI